MEPTEYLRSFKMFAILPLQFPFTKYAAPVRASSGAWSVPVGLTLYHTRQLPTASIRLCFELSQIESC